MNIKIFVGYHKPYQLLKSEIFIPIHLGRTAAKEQAFDTKLNKKDVNWLKTHMIGDNTGDNISYRNREYCELTGIYWLWKNYDIIGNPDYIGFMQYRRHFIFNEDVYNSYKSANDNEKTYKQYTVGSIFDGYEEYFGLKDSIIQNYCGQYDCIIPKKVELKYSNIKSIRDDYHHAIEGTNIKDFDLMLKIVKKYMPAYYHTLQKQAYNDTGYFYQSFILKKKIFFEYCDFLFNILNILDSKIDTSAYSNNGKRTLGYLGEKLFNCFMETLISDNRYKVKELGLTFICTPSIPKPIKQKTAIVLLVFADFESLEITIACYSKYFQNDTKLFILQNGRGTYDCERTYRVAKRYENLFPRNIEVIDFIPPQRPYNAIKMLLEHEKLKDYEYICKVDDDVFPVTEDWFDRICDCYEKQYARYGNNLAYVSVMINNNSFGFKKLIQNNKILSDEYFAYIAREHKVGFASKHPYYEAEKIISKTKISDTACGTTWRIPYISRWLHKKTTLHPEQYIAMTKELPDVECSIERYSINCMLFRKEYWNDIYNKDDVYNSDDEHLSAVYCRTKNKKIIVRLSIPFVHLFFFPQREENRDLLKQIREVYENRLSLPFPVSMCPEKEIENENRLRFLEEKLDRLAWELNRSDKKDSWFQRKTHGFFRCIRDNGFVYTTKLMIKKSLRKLGKKQYITG